MRAMSQPISSSPSPSLYSDAPPAAVQRALEELSQSPLRVARRLVALEVELRRLDPTTPLLPRARVGKGEGEGEEGLGTRLLWQGRQGGDGGEVEDGAREGRAGKDEIVLGEDDAGGESSEDVPLADAGFLSGAKGEVEGVARKEEAGGVVSLEGANEEKLEEDDEADLLEVRRSERGVWLEQLDEVANPSDLRAVKGCVSSKVDNTLLVYDGESLGAPDVRCAIAQSYKSLKYRPPLRSGEASASTATRCGRADANERKASDASTAACTGRLNVGVAKDTCGEEVEDTPRRSQRPTRATSADEALGGNRRAVEVHGGGSDSEEELIISRVRNRRRRPRRVRLVASDSESNEETGTGAGPAVVDVDEGGAHDAAADGGVVLDVHDEDSAREHLPGAGAPGSPLGSAAKCPLKRFGDCFQAVQSRQDSVNEVRAARRAAAERSMSPEIVSVAPFDSESPVRRSNPRPRGRKRMRATSKGSRRKAVKRQLVGWGQSDDSGSQLSGSFLAGSDSDGEEESDAEEVGAHVSMHPPESLFEENARREVGGQTIFASNKEAFKIYLRALATCALDRKYQAAFVGHLRGQRDLLSSYSLEEAEENLVRFQLDQFAHAVTRVEKDLFRARAVGFVADGRWRTVTKALHARPFLTKFNELYLLPQAINNQKEYITYCNGCNYRFVEPTVTAVLYGPEVDQEDDDGACYWPEAIAESAIPGSGLEFPSDDIDAVPLLGAKVEQTYRYRRMKWWREHHHVSAGLPLEERKRAEAEGIADADWGRRDPEKTNVRRRVTEDGGEIDSDESDGNESCSQASSDRGTEGQDEYENLLGFGMSENCYGRLVLYHQMLWIRLAIARIVRKGILDLYRSGGYDCEFTLPIAGERLSKIVDLVTDEDSQYSVLNKCRRCANELLSQSRSYERAKKSKNFTEEKLALGEFELETEDIEV